MKHQFFSLIVLNILLVVLLVSCTVGPLSFAADPAGRLLRPYENKTLSEPDFVDYTVARYYYAGLSDIQQQAYRIIYNAVFSFPEKILLPGVSETQLSEVMRALKYDNPHIVFLSGTYQYYAGSGMNYLIPSYLFSAKEAQTKIRQMMKTARRIAEDASEQPDTFSKELYIHDALCEKCAYASGANADTAYGALIQGQAVCEGYSLGAKLLFDLAGIQSFVVMGKASAPETPETTHMWNVLQVDGDWYYLDCTWDDPVVSDGASFVRHAYFNPTPEKLESNHYAFTLPADIVCSGVENNYFRRFSLYCTAENWRQTVERGLAEAENAPGAEFCFETAALMREAVGTLVRNGELSAYFGGKEISDLHYTTDADVCAVYFRFGTGDPA
ncbi:MAG: hypothetical protein IJT27_08975 [Clostridia bacterium]|nr:hypothetical protein [Clostridia bacterium]